jgi:endonuclease/exonuclease/phosphatase family metal-dependent hydrolase
MLSTEYFRALGEFVELKCAWWNCRLSPPKNGATQYAITDGFNATICELLARGVDILGLCEVARVHLSHLEQLLEDYDLARYKVLDLYSGGKSIDDFCLIYNSEKFSTAIPLESANVRDALSNTWLKAGVFTQLQFMSGENLFVGLSHWQSRQTFAEGSVNRLRLGQALRNKINEIMDESPSAPIILFGDYNDEPYHDSIVKGIGASRDAEFVRKRPHYFYNPYWGCLGYREGILPPGSYVHASAIEGSGGAVYDQILFSSHFLKNWIFQCAGSIVSDIPQNESKLLWSDISDHYPVLSHLVRNQL